MMKKPKCPICSQTAGKRVCWLLEDSLICPRCCAQKRSAECGSCQHAVMAGIHEGEKMINRSTYMFRVDPEVDEVVSNTLERIQAGKNVTAAREKIVELYNKHPDLYVTHFGMAISHALAGQPEEADGYFQSCLNLNPVFPEAWYNKGLNHNKMRQHTSMLKCYQKVLQFGDETEEYYEHAKDLVQIVTSESGKSISAYIRRAEEFDNAVTEMDHQRFPEAIRGFLKVLKDDPDHVQTHGNLGVCYGALDRRTEALLFLHRALELDPTYLLAAENMRVILALKPGEKLLEKMGYGTTHYYLDRIEGKLP